MSESCWDEVLETKPEATLAIRRSAFHLLQLGRPVRIEEAADAAGLTVDTALEAAELVASVGMAELDEGTIVGMDGLTTRRTQHQVVLNSIELWTWCAMTSWASLPRSGRTPSAPLRAGCAGERSRSSFAADVPVRRP
jgi:hypothetical protein